MKSLLTILILVSSVAACFAKQQSVEGRKLTDLKVIPASVLQRSVSPKFYNSLLVSPLKGWVTLRGNLAGTRLSGVRIVRSDLKGLFDPLGFQLAKEAVIAGNYTIERPNTPASVLLHLLVYDIADGTMVLSFAHFDGPGGNQMEYYGCARLLVLKNEKWTEIQGPESLQGKGWAVRRGTRNSYELSMKMEIRTLQAESTNMNTGSR